MNDIKLSVAEFAANCKANGFYYHQQTLVRSVEGHDVDIITVTGGDSDSTPGDAIPDPARILYPAKPGLKADFPHRFGKKTIYLSSRVHCGETVASFILQGIFDFISSGSEQAKLLLQTYVFKIVPILNPDGVYRGYWRNDVYGVNLNRVYAEPDPVLAPTIYASKAAVLHEHAKGTLFAFIDLHGHCTKRGCFVFGNTIKADESIEQLVLPKVLSLNCVNFDFQECSYNDADNNKKDKKGDSRSGSSRATLFRETQIPFCFTLEGNYATGLRINTLQSRFNSSTGKKMLKEDRPV